MLPELDVEYEIEFGDSFRLNSKSFNTLMMKFVPQYALGDYGVLESNSSLASRDMRIQFQNSSNPNEVVTLVGNGKSTNNAQSQQQHAVLLFDPERECFVLERVGGVYHTTRVEEKEKRPSKAYQQLKRDRPYMDEIVARNVKKMKETNKASVIANANIASSQESQSVSTKTKLRLEEGSDSSSDDSSDEDSFGDLEGKVAGMFGDSNSDDSEDIPSSSASSLLKNNSNGNSAGDYVAGLKKPRVVKISDSESSSTSSDESSDES